MTNLEFKRRLSRSMDNKASVITIPRPIALAWEQYDLVNLIFNGDSLVITPSDGSRQPQRDERA
jgi:virulence-associated protein VagC